MKKHFFNHLILAAWLMVVAFAGVSCGTENREPETTTAGTSADAVADTLPVPADGSTSQNSLDYFGTYKGVTPCADCAGIEVTLTLLADSTYSHSMVYMGKGDGTPVVKTGKYSWTPDGSTVQLEGITDGPNKFKVGENQLWQLDMAGNKVEGELAEKYILKKS